MYDGKYNDREGCILNVSVMMYGSSQGKYCQPFTMPILFHPLITAVLYGESVKSLMRANCNVSKILQLISFSNYQNHHQFLML